MINKFKFGLAATAVLMSVSTMAETKTVAMNDILLVENSLFKLTEIEGNRCLYTGKVEKIKDSTEKKFQLAIHQKVCGDGIVHDVLIPINPSKPIRYGDVVVVND